MGDCANPDANLPDLASLSDVVWAALCRNPKTRALRAASLAQDANVGLAKSSFWPTLSASVNVEASHVGGHPSDLVPGTGSQQQGQSNVVMSYLLYDFGARDAALENAQQLLRAANALRSAGLQSLFLSVVQAYFNLGAAQASTKSYAEAVAAANQSWLVTTERYKVGAVTGSDVLQAKTALSQAQLNLISAQGNAKVAEGQLASLMGLSPAVHLKLAPIQLEAVLPNASADSQIESLIAQAQQLRPDLVAAQAQFDAASANVRAVQAQGKPTLSVGPSASMVRNFGPTYERYSTSVGLTLNVPIFTGYHDTYAVRQAQAVQESALANRDETANQVALDVWQAYQGLLTSGLSVTSAGDLVRSAQAAFDAARGRYAAGVGTLADLLNAQSALSSAQQSLLNTRYNLMIARFALAQALGDLDMSSVTGASSR